MKYFLYMYEYGTLKPVEVILRSRRRERMMEGMNQMGALYIVRSLAFLGQAEGPKATP
jgi:hypothetical protein